MKLTTRILLVFILITMFILIPSQASAGLRVTDAVLNVTVTPGDVITHKMSVGLRETDSAMDIAVTVNDLGKYSAKDYITIDNPSFHLEPGQSQDVTATIRIPLDAGEGGKYAMINIGQQQAAGTSVGVLVAVDVPIFLTIKDTPLIHTGKITGITTSKAVSGQPVDIFTNFQNTGNHHFQVKGEVLVSNTQGEVLDTIYTALTTSSLVPTMSTQLKATYIPKGELSLGVYTIKSTVMLDDGTVLDTASGSFEVAEPYVPPPPPASVTLTPGSAAVLETADKAISINFPKGAVTGQVDVSLRSYPAAQLPSPPTGYTAATTCFRVDGLTGLLAQQATVTVRYTGADLDKAKGDVSRLTLARWDEATNKWSVLKTKADTSAMTLTTQTDRFSIWAVMVAPLAKTNWVIIGGAIAAVIIIVGALITVLTRKKV